MIDGFIYRMNEPGDVRDGNVQNVRFRMPACLSWPGNVHCAVSDRELGLSYYVYPSGGFRLAQAQAGIEDVLTAAREDGLLVSYSKARAEFWR
jgi:hypothetical protein